ncbi:hypothetical protein [Nonomuraea sp. NPDC050786]|uniref:hypothetical protein n=1 Tax=Nonomuraea sp. NPDC050786 TaxID=3154840 RepID=UPI0033E24EB2
MADALDLVTQFAEAEGAFTERLDHITDQEISWLFRNAGIEQAAREFDLATPPAALIGVDMLFEPGILIEAEVTAIID